MSVIAMDHTSPIAATILALLAERAPAATICPSEVARALSPEDWRALMPAVRAEARALAADGYVKIRQRGHTVAPDAELRGPIRLALP